MEHGGEGGETVNVEEARLPDCYMRASEKGVDFGLSA